MSLGATVHRIEGVGLGWRPELAADLFARPDVVDFVEVVAESCFTQRAALREARALAELWPVVPHGVKLSLGSADGIEDDRAKKLGALARELKAPFVTEHVAFTRGGTVEIGHLTQLPRTREAVRVVARNVDRARRFIDVPLYLENVAFSFLFPDDEMDDADFYAAVAEATGCPLLLDISNLHANALNEGLDPHDVLARFPVERVAMVHVAGGVLEDGFFFDTHAHAIPPLVLELLASLCARQGPVPVLLERDASFPPFEFLVAELEACRLALATGVENAHVPVTSPARDEGALSSTLLERQLRCARLLTDETPSSSDDVLGIGASSLVRARDILARKRIEDALPLLARLARLGDGIVALAGEALRGTKRASTGAGLLDAWRIATRALDEPQLSAAARVDLLLLRARFAGPDDAGRLVARRGPFLGTTRLPDGRRCLAIKPPGVQAQIRFLER